MDRIWRFLKGLLGRRTDASAKPDPQLVAKFGPGGDYSEELWLDGHRWQYDNTNKKWVNKLEQW
jgi:hypothetical protein